MINTKNLTPSHLWFIMGIWRAYMGGDKILDISAEKVEKWCGELKRTDNLVTYRIGSRWCEDHSISFAGNETGIMAFCWQEIYRTWGLCDEAEVAACRFKAATENLN